MSGDGGGNFPLHPPKSMQRAAGSLSMSASAEFLRYNGDVAVCFGPQATLTSPGLFLSKMPRSQLAYVSEHLDDPSVSSIRAAVLSSISWFT
jgi:hypothetical protein